MNAIDPTVPPTPAQLIQAHQFIYYVLSQNVLSDYEYGAYCKANGLEGNGGSDCERDYPPEIVKLAKWIAHTRNPIPSTWPL